MTLSNPLSKNLIGAPPPPKKGPFLRLIFAVYLHNFKRNFDRIFLLLFCLVYFPKNFRLRTFLFLLRNIGRTFFSVVTIRRHFYCVIQQVYLAILIFIRKFYWYQFTLFSSNFSVISTQTKQMETLVGRV